MDDFQAVGGGGQAVFESALQIREALRLRKQQAIVDCLAIPQVNDGADRVDWYSPVEGAVSSWKAASEDERYRALRYLENTLASVESLSKKCLQSPKTAQQLFGSLLAKAFQFPGENFLFLVEGKPVICFWGFVNLNESARDDVLDCLRESLIPDPEPVVIEEPEPASEPEPEPEAEPEPAAVVSFEKADEPLIAPPPPTTLRITPDALYAPEPAPVTTATDDLPATPAKRRLPLWSVAAGGGGGYRGRSRAAAVAKTGAVSRACRGPRSDSGRRRHRAEAGRTAGADSAAGAGRSAGEKRASAGAGTAARGDRRHPERCAGDGCRSGPRRFDPLP